MENKKIDDLRCDLDEIDDKIVELLNQRIEKASQIGASKAEASNSQVFIPEREAAVLERLATKSCKNLDAKSLEEIYREIFSVCRKVQFGGKVCVLGEKHGWVNASALNRFGTASEIMVGENFDDFMSLMAHGRGNLGFVPVTPDHGEYRRNIYEALLSRRLSVCEQFELKPEFALVSNRARELSEAQEICVTNETLKFFDKFLVSLSFDLKINICRSMSEVLETLGSINPVAAILPAAMLKLFPELILLQRDLFSDRLGNIKFFSVTTGQAAPMKPGCRMILLFVLNRFEDKFSEICSIMSSCKTKVVDVQKLSFGNKPLESILVAEIIIPEDTGTIETMLKELEANSFIVTCAGVYPFVAAD